jgi:D-alanyl-lipoteichoic acid acyltransferase DltB (MBOAT superfamily)
VKYALLIVGVTIVTYLCAIAMDKFKVHKKNILAVGCIINLLVLFVFKYFNFTIESINFIFEKLGSSSRFSLIDVVLPVGISFYIFQAIGYMVDVYRGDVEVEYNFFQYALFVSFFPQLVAGPIERSTKLLGQLRRLDNISYDETNLKQGILQIMWGLFEKTIIADRISIVVDEVYGSYEHYGLVPIALATVLFAVQIYCDFDGYTRIARGVARTMGINLMDNFKEPYCATSIHEFWERWHISLSSWFKDYLYIPLGGNRKGKLRKNINVLIVFLVSGLWHGADWTFVIWGGIHGILNVIENITGCAKRKNATLSARIRNIVITFGLVDAAWFFFRVDNFAHAKAMLIQMASQLGDVSDLLECMGANEWQVLAVAILILVVVDLLRYNHISVLAFVEKQELWFRWAVYLALVCMIVYMQVYSVTYESSQFIYFQF